MKKKYTVFVSSTYEDLKEERQEVMKALLEMDCIPCGMEYFPATEDKTLRYIKRIIDDCDYYVLILGGKYGSTDAKGMSYTEKEYRYAKKQKIPMISFIRSDLDSLPRAKCELDPAKAERLEKFRKLTSDKKVCRFWSNKDGLARAVTSSMTQLIQDTPRDGWIRAEFPVEEAEAALDEYRLNNIRHIHTKGQAVNTFEQILKSTSCRKLRILGFSAQGFTHSYRSELANLLSAGGDIQFLLSNPETQFIEQASEMEGRPASAIARSVFESIDIIKTIIAKAQRRAKERGTVCGSFEIRYYDTELRNQLMICEDKDDRHYAWMTVLTPPLAAVNCPMIEFSDASRCDDYFNTIWNRHEQNSVTL